MRTICMLMLLSLLLPCFAATAPDTASKPVLAPPTLAQAREVQTQGRYLATIIMENGKKIELVLEGAYAPYTVANFLNLINAKFYDGLLFHRVEKDFVIQGGDPQANGSGGPGYDINLEVSPFLRHGQGALSMARTNKPDTAGSQFFVTMKPTPFLDGAYAVFGWVKSGMEVVTNVVVGDKMRSVTVTCYDGEEPCPILAPEFAGKTDKPE